jgi:RNA polymerase sigma-70 factor, ECF subfamily
MVMRVTAMMTANAGTGPALDNAPAQLAVPLTIEAIYEAHFDFVWRTARRLGASEAHVDDIVQEVFMVVQRRLADFEGRSEVKTWLFGIARRVVRGYMRRHSRRTSETEASELPDTAAPSAESQLEALEGSRLLQALLDELDADKREVFVLCELEEMSGPQIAAALDLSLSNVYARIRVARQAFDAALKRHRARSSVKRQP